MVDTRAPAPTPRAIYDLVNHSLSILRPNEGQSPPHTLINHIICFLLAEIVWLVKEGPDWGVVRWAQAGAVFFSREWPTTHSDLCGAQRIACFPHEEPVISLNTRLSACSLVSCSGRLDWALGVVTQRDTGCPIACRLPGDLGT